MSVRDCIVVGGGVAGTEAAAAIRAKDPAARIRILTDETWPYYARIRLGEVVDGRIAPEGLFLRLPGWYDQQRIEVQGGVRVEGIDPATAQVRVGGGGRLSYDALLLAVGARPFVPPFPGAELPVVATLRRMDDALELKRRAQKGGTCVVVGGGLLGLELAVSLAGAGFRATVVEAAPWLLPRQVDAAGGEVLREVLQRRGVDFRLASGVEGVEAGAGAARVTVKGGQSLPADLVVVSAGVRPDIALAREAGVAVDKGIVVDDALRTSAVGVWAAGDCAQHRTGLYGFWSANGEQGKAAGASMAGDPVAYAGSVRQSTLKVGDVAVFGIGDLSAPFVREETARDGDAYRCIRMDEVGRVTGAVLIGDMAERKALVLASMSGRPYRAA